MATADEIRKSEVDSRLESRKRLEQLREAVEYLMALDPHELRPEDYAEIEEAILKVWVRTKVREDIGWFCRGITSDIRTSLTDLHLIAEDTRRHVNQARGAGIRRGTRGIACSGFFRSPCGEET